jgi:Wiskott-Aldrich syndrome protein
MPAQSALTADEKAKVKSAIPNSSNTTVYAALARIYYAHPDPNYWAYAGLQGGLALVRDDLKNAYFFRLIDLDGTRGVIWEHELYDGFELFQDRPFFHSFMGDVSSVIVFTCAGMLTFNLRTAWSDSSTLRRVKLRTSSISAASARS